MIEYQDIIDELEARLAIAFENEECEVMLLRAELKILLEQLKAANAVVRKQRIAIDLYDAARESVKIRIAYIGHPKEPEDWSIECRLLEQAYEAAAQSAAIETKEAAARTAKGETP